MVDDAESEMHSPCKEGALKQARVAYNYLCHAAGGREKGLCHTCTEAQANVSVSKTSDR